MAIKFEKITVGMMLADIHRERMGNTTMSLDCLWWVKVLEINTAKKEALVSWNGNTPRRWTRRQLERLYKEGSPKVLRLLEKQRLER